MTEPITVHRYSRFKSDPRIHRGLSRLLTWAVRQEKTCDLLGVSARELARREFFEYTSGDYILFAALAKNRVVGLLAISHESSEGLLLGHRVWEIRKMLVAPEAPGRVPGELVIHAMHYMGMEDGFVRARVAAWDGASINALVSNDFRVVTGDALCVFHGASPSLVRHPDFSFASLNPGHLKDAVRLSVPCSTLSSQELKTGQPDRMEALANNMLCRCMNSENAGAIVARHNEKLIGYVQFEIPRGKWNGLMAKLSLPIVLPEYAARGVFELLVRQALQAVSNMGLDAASMHLPLNEYSTSRQLRSLHKLGFVVVRSDLLLRHWNLARQLRFDIHENGKLFGGENSMEKQFSKKLSVQPPTNRPVNRRSPQFVPAPPGGDSSSLPSSRRGESSS